jgi:hypothetical protein
VKILENGKALMEYESLSGKIYPVEVNLVADARDVVGLAGFPWIVIAANPQLSNDKISWFLSTCGIDGVERSSGWIQRHRGMFRRVRQQPAGGCKEDADGNYARAVRIMREYPTESARHLVYILKEHQIKRSREWVRQHRCDRLPDDS